MSKFQNRVVVYSVDGGSPIFFDVDGRGTDIFPTGLCFFVPSILYDFSFYWK